MKENKNKTDEQAAIIYGACNAIYSVAKFVLIIYSILALSKYIGG